jgi:hypothetical protein
MFALRKKRKNETHSDGHMKSGQEDRLFPIKARVNLDQFSPPLAKLRIIAWDIYTYVREIQGGKDVFVEDDHRGAYRQLFVRSQVKREQRMNEEETMISNRDHVNADC